MYRCMLFSMLLALPTGPLTAADPREDLFRTGTYEVGDLLHRTSGKTGFDRMEELVRNVMTVVNPAGWHAREGGSSLRILNGSTLVIHASAKHHHEIGELLESLRRLTDVAVDIQGYLCEIDRSLYDKTIKPKLGNVQGGGDFLPAARIDHRPYLKLRDKLQVVTSNKVRVANGKEAEFLSLWDAVRMGMRPRLDDKQGPRKPQPPEAIRKDRADIQEMVAQLLEKLREKGFDSSLASTNRLGEPTLAMHGVGFKARATVSADRRFVEMRIHQDVVNLLNLEEVPFGDEKVFVFPSLSRSGATTTVRVGDGEVLFVPVHYLPRSLKDRNLMHVLIVQPTIWIEAEEKERQKSPPLP